MLQGRLSLLAAASGMLLVGCGSVDGSDDGVLRENVVEPGIEAIEDGGTADAAACGVDASAMRTAMESFTLLVGEPPPDEAAMVERGFLRAESELWDVVGGELVAQDPGCGAVPNDVPAVDMVTGVDAPTVDEVFAQFDDDDIDQLGGEACAREIAEIFAAGEAFVAATGTGAADLDALISAGLLGDRPELWEFDGANLVPVDGSGCNDVS